METRNARRNYYSRLRERGRLHGTIKAALEKWDKRQELQSAYREPTRLELYRKLAGELRGIITVPLGEHLERKYLSIARKAYPRLREWSLSAESDGRGYRTAWRLIEKGSNSDWSKRSTFQRGIMVSCWAEGSTIREAVLHVGEEAAVRVPAPRGYKWWVDKGGLCLMDRKGNEYHPTASEMLESLKPGQSRLIADKLKDAAAIRKEQRAAARLYAKTKQERIKQWQTVAADGGVVCLRDSLRAGNCEGGTLSWVATVLGRPARGHIPLRLLLGKGLADNVRVANAVGIAVRRHLTEMRQGFCSLADHS